MNSSNRQFPLASDGSKWLSKELVMANYAWTLSNSKGSHGRCSGCLQSLQNGFLHSLKDQTAFFRSCSAVLLHLLVCIGEHDLAFSKEAMEATYLDWLPNSRLEIIANAGHYPMQEAPVNLATVIDAFMRENI